MLISLRETRGTALFISRREVVLESKEDLANIQSDIFLTHGYAHILWSSIYKLYVIMTIYFLGITCRFTSTYTSSTQHQQVKICKNAHATTWFGCAYF